MQQQTIAATDKKQQAPAPSRAPLVVAKVDERRVREALVAENLGAPDEVRKWEIGFAAKLLDSHYEKTVPRANQSTCDVCEGLSDNRLDACPFCGEGDAAPAQPTPATPAPAAAPTEVQENKKTKQAEGGQEKKTMNTQQQTTTTPAAKAPAPTSTALAPTNGNGKAKVLTKAEADLDERVHRVIALKGETGASMWRLGSELAELEKGQLWKARTGERGKPTYKHWNQFCNKELGMSPTNAYKLIDVARAFDEATVRKFGTSKLGLVLTAPADEQPRLLKMAEQHSKKKLQAAVTEAKAKTGHKRETGRKKMPDAPAKRAAPASKIDVATILKTQTVQLWAKPDKGKEPTKRAGRLADEPVGYLDLANGVRQYFEVVSTDKGLALKVIARREE